jgi:bifunctional UDP-N-acetylglucosamine pyrophosphorylase/glucosamine-1-phosphate N-acetyltransferase
MIRDAVVMCAGKGLGLLPLTGTVPKPLIRINGKSMLCMTIEGLKDAGVENAYFVTNYLEEGIIGEAKAICKEKGISPFFIHQEKALGTADAVKSAKGKIVGPFLVASGDHVLDFSIYRDMAEAFDGESAVALKRVRNPSNYGVAEVENGRIKEMVEKPKVPKTDLANLGIYIFSQGIFREIENVVVSQRNEYEITDVLKGKKAFITGKYWLDVGLPWALLEAMDFLFSIEKRKIVIEKGADVDRDSVKLKGNVHIGKGCAIKNSVIGDSCIGEGCKIENSEIKKSLIGENNEIQSSVISHSAIGNGIRMEDAVLESKANAKISTKKGEKTSPGEFGSVVGDNSTIKGRILPGSLISKQ